MAAPAAQAGALTDQRSASDVSCLTRALRIIEASFGILSTRFDINESKNLLS
jgi:hypothetical protein